MKKKLNLKLFNKFIAILVVSCFFVSSVCRDAIAAAVTPATMNAQEYKQIFNDFMLPYSYGKISGSHFAGTDRVVINIQDLHCHPQVQKSISDIIEMFDNKYGVSTVYLEGAYGNISAKPFLKNLTYPIKKNEILDKLLESGRLTGAEYYSAISNKTEIIKGLEKERPYLENLKRFGNLLEVQDQISVILKGVEESTKKVKKQYYTRRQYKIEKLSKQYLEGKIKAEKYYKLLSKHTEKLGIDLTKYENTFLYIQLLALQSELNYKEITKQLQTLVFVLKENLPPNAYQILLDNTKNFEQTDKLYTYIIKISKSFGLDLAVNFKELNKYFNFIELSQKINPLELLKEEENLTREINTRFSDTVAQREVVFLTNFEKYLKDYLTTKITADDYEYYKENIEIYKNLWNKYVDNKVLTLLEPYMKETDKFYKINTARNNYFTENIFNGIKTNKIENIQEETDEVNKIIENMDKVKRVDVIITGGFHSQTVSNILKQHGISYIVITPNVQDGVKEAEKTYYQIAKQQKEINFQTLAAMPIFELYGIEAARIAFIKFLKDSGISIEEAKTLFGNEDNRLVTEIFNMSDEEFKEEYGSKHYGRLQESISISTESIDEILNALFSANYRREKKYGQKNGRIDEAEAEENLKKSLGSSWDKVSPEAKTQLVKLEIMGLVDGELREFILEAVTKGWNKNTVLYFEENDFYYEINGEKINYKYNEKIEKKIDNGELECINSDEKKAVVLKNKDSSGKVIQDIWTIKDNNLEMSEETTTRSLNNIIYSAKRDAYNQLKTEDENTITNMVKVAENLENDAINQEDLINIIKVIAPAYGVDVSDEKKLEALTTEIIELIKQSEDNSFLNFFANIFKSKEHIMIATVINKYLANSSKNIQDFLENAKEYGKVEYDKSEGDIYYEVGNRRVYFKSFVEFENKKSKAAKTIKELPDKFNFERNVLQEYVKVLNIENPKDEEKLSRLSKILNSEEKTEELIYNLKVSNQTDGVPNIEKAIEETIGTKKSEEKENVTTKRVSEKAEAKSSVVKKSDDIIKEINESIDELDADVDIEKFNEKNFFGKLNNIVNTIAVSDLSSEDEEKLNKKLAEIIIKQYKNLLIQKSKKVNAHKLRNISSDRFEKGLNDKLEKFIEELEKSNLSTDLKLDVINGILKIDKDKEQIGGGVDTRFTLENSETIKKQLEKTKTELEKKSEKENMEVELENKLKLLFDEKIDLFENVGQGEILKKEIENSSLNSKDKEILIERLNEKILFKIKINELNNNEKLAKQLKKEIRNSSLKPKDKELLIREIDEKVKFEEKIESLENVKQAEELKQEIKKSSLSLDNKNKLNLQIDKKTKLNKKISNFEVYSKDYSAIEEENEEKVEGEIEKEIKEVKEELQKPLWKQQEKINYNEQFNKINGIIINISESPLSQERKDKLNKQLEEVVYNTINKIALINLNEDEIFNLMYTIINSGLSDEFKLKFFTNMLENKDIYLSNKTRQLLKFEIEARQLNFSTENSEEELQKFNKEVDSDTALESKDKKILSSQANSKKYEFRIKQLKFDDKNFKNDIENIQNEINNDNTLISKDMLNLLAQVSYKKYEAKIEQLSFDDKNFEEETENIQKEINKDKSLTLKDKQKLLVQLNYKRHEFKIQQLQFNDINFEKEATNIQKEINKDTSLSSREKNKLLEQLDIKNLKKLEYDIKNSGLSKKDEDNLIKKSREKYDIEKDIESLNYIKNENEQSSFVDKITIKINNSSLSSEEKNELKKKLVNTTKLLSAGKKTRLINEGVKKEPTYLETLEKTRLERKSEEKKNEYEIEINKLDVNDRKAVEELNEDILSNKYLTDEHKGLLLGQISDKQKIAITNKIDNFEPEYIIKKEVKVERIGSNKDLSSEDKESISELVKEIKETYYEGHPYREDLLRRLEINVNSNVVEIEDEDNIQKSVNNNIVPFIEGFIFGPLAAQVSLYLVSNILMISSPLIAIPLVIGIWLFMKYVVFNALQIKKADIKKGTVWQNFKSRLPAINKISYLYISAITVSALLCFIPIIPSIFILSNSFIAVSAITGIWLFIRYIVFNILQITKTDIKGKTVWKSFKSRLPSIKEIPNFYIVALTLPLLLLALGVAPTFASIFIWSMLIITIPSTYLYIKNNKTGKIRLSIFDTGADLYNELKYERKAEEQREKIKFENYIKQLDINRINVITIMEGINDSSLNTIDKCKLSKDFVSEIEKSDMSEDKQELINIVTESIFETIKEDIEQLSVNSQNVKIIIECINNSPLSLEDKNKLSKKLINKIEKSDIAIKEQQNLINTVKENTIDIVEEDIEQISINSKKSEINIEEQNDNENIENTVEDTSYLQNLQNQALKYFENKIDKTNDEKELNNLKEEIENNKELYLTEKQRKYLCEIINTKINAKKIENEIDKLEIKGTITQEVSLADIKNNNELSIADKENINNIVEEINKIKDSSQKNNLLEKLETKINSNIQNIETEKVTSLKYIVFHPVSWIQAKYRQLKYKFLKNDENTYVLNDDGSLNIEEIFSALQKPMIEENIMFLIKYLVSHGDNNIKSEIFSFVKNNGKSKIEFFINKYVLNSAYFTNRISNVTLFVSLLNDDTLKELNKLDKENLNKLWNFVKDLDANTIAIFVNSLNYEEETYNEFISILSKGEKERKEFLIKIIEKEYSYLKETIKGTELENFKNFDNYSYEEIIKIFNFVIGNNLSDENKIKFLNLLLSDKENENKKVKFFLEFFEKGDIINLSSLSKKDFDNLMNNLGNIKDNSELNTIKNNLGYSYNTNFKKFEDIGLMDKIYKEKLYEYIKLLSLNNKDVNYCFEASNLILYGLYSENFYSSEEVQKIIKYISSKYTKIPEIESKLLNKYSYSQNESIDERSKKRNLIDGFYRFVMSDNYSDDNKVKLLNLLLSDKENENKKAEHFLVFFEREGILNVDDLLSEKDFNRVINDLMDTLYIIDKENISKLYSIKNGTAVGGHESLSNFVSFLKEIEKDKNICVNFNSFLKEIDTPGILLRMFMFDRPEDKEKHISEMIDFINFFNELKDTDKQEIIDLLKVVFCSSFIGKDGKKYIGLKYSQMYLSNNCFVLKMYLNKNFRNKFDEVFNLQDGVETIYPDSDGYDNNYYVNELIDWDKSLARKNGLLETRDHRTVALYKRAGAFTVLLNQINSNEEIRNSFGIEGKIDFETLQEDEETLNNLTGIFFDNYDKLMQLLDENQNNKQVGESYVRKGQTIVSVSHNETDKKSFPIGRWFSMGIVIVYYLLYGIDIRNFNDKDDFENGSFFAYKIANGIQNNKYEETKHLTDVKNKKELLEKSGENIKYAVVNNSNGSCFITDVHGYEFDSNDEYKYDKDKFYKKGGVFSLSSTKENKEELFGIDIISLYCESIEFDDEGNVIPGSIEYLKDRKGKDIKDLSNQTIILDSCVSFYSKHALEIKFKECGFIPPKIISGAGEETRYTIIGLNIPFKNKNTITTSLFYGIIDSLRTDKLEGQKMPKELNSSYLLKADTYEKLSNHSVFVQDSDIYEEFVGVLNEADYVVANNYKQGRVKIEKVSKGILGIFSQIPFLKSIFETNNSSWLSTPSPMLSILSPFVEWLLNKIGIKNSLVLSIYNILAAPIWEEQIFGKIVSLGVMAFMASNPFGWMTGGIAFGLFVAARLLFVVLHYFIADAGEDKMIKKQNLKYRLIGTFVLSIPYAISIFSGGMLNIGTATLIATLIHSILNYIGNKYGLPSFSLLGLGDKLKSIFGGNKKDDKLKLILDELDDDSKDFFVNFMKLAEIENKEEVENLLYILNKITATSGSTTLAKKFISIIINIKKYNMVDSISEEELNENNIKEIINFIDINSLKDIYDNNSYSASGAFLEIRKKITEKIINELRKNETNNDVALKENLKEKICDNFNDSILVEDEIYFLKHLLKQDNDDIERIINSFSGIKQFVDVILSGQIYFRERSFIPNFKTFLLDVEIDKEMAKKMTDTEKIEKIEQLRDKNFSDFSDFITKLENELNAKDNYSAIDRNKIRTDLLMFLFRDKEIFDCFMKNKENQSKLLNNLSVINIDKEYNGAIDFYRLPTDVGINLLMGYIKPVNLKEWYRESPVNTDEIRKMQTNLNPIFKCGDEESFWEENKEVAKQRNCNDIDKTTELFNAFCNYGIDISENSVANNIFKEKTGFSIDEIKKGTNRDIMFRRNEKELKKEQIKYSSEDIIAMYSDDIVYAIALTMKQKDEKGNNIRNENFNRLIEDKKINYIFKCPLFDGPCLVPYSEILNTGYVIGDCTGNLAYGKNNVYFRNHRIFLKNFNTVIYYKNGKLIQKYMIHYDDNNMHIMSVEEHQDFRDNKNNQEDEDIDFKEQFFFESLDFIHEIAKNNEIENIYIETGNSNTEWLMESVRKVTTKEKSKSTNLLTQGGVDQLLKLNIDFDNIDSEMKKIKYLASKVKVYRLLTGAGIYGSLVIVMYEIQNFINNISRHKELKNSLYTEIQLQMQEDDARISNYAQEGHKQEKTNKFYEKVDEVKKLESILNNKNIEMEDDKMKIKSGTDVFYNFMDEFSKIIKYVPIYKLSNDEEGFILPIGYGKVLKVEKNDKKIKLTGKGYNQLGEEEIDENEYEIPKEYKENIDIILGLINNIKDGQIEIFKTNKKMVKKPIDKNVKASDCEIDIIGCKEGKEDSPLTFKIVDKEKKIHGYFTVDIAISNSWNATIEEGTIETEPIIEESFIDKITTESNGLNNSVRKEIESKAKNNKLSEIIISFDKVSSKFSQSQTRQEKSDVSQTGILLSIFDETVDMSNPAYPIKALMEFISGMFNENKNKEIILYRNGQVSENTIKELEIDKPDREFVELDIIKDVEENPVNGKVIDIFNGKTIRMKYVEENEEKKLKIFAQGGLEDTEIEVIKELIEQAFKEGRMLGIFGNSDNNVIAFLQETENSEEDVENAIRTAKINAMKKAEAGIVYDASKDESLTLEAIKQEAKGASRIVLNEDQVEKFAEDLKNANFEVIVRVKRNKIDKDNIKYLIEHYGLNGIILDKTETGNKISVPEIKDLQEIANNNIKDGKIINTQMYIEGDSEYEISKVYNEYGIIPIVSTNEAIKIKEGKFSINFNSEINETTIKNLLNSGQLADIVTTDSIEKFRENLAGKIIDEIGNRFDSLSELLKPRSNKKRYAQEAKAVINVNVDFGDIIEKDNLTKALTNKESPLYKLITSNQEDLSKDEIKQNIEQLLGLNILSKEAQYHLEKLLKEGGICEAQGAIRGFVMLAVEDIMISQLGVDTDSYNKIKESLRKGKNSEVREFMMIRGIQALMLGKNIEDWLNEEIVTKQTVAEVLEYGLRIINQNKKMLLISCEDKIILESEEKVKEGFEYFLDVIEDLGTEGTEIERVNDKDILKAARGMLAAA